jgi:hypothetical protein
MDILRRLILVLFGLFLSIGCGIATLIYGWGLQPKNWWAIIGIGIFGQLVAQMIIAISASKK